MTSLIERETIPPVTDLQGALEHALSRYFGAPRCISRLDREASEYITSFTIEELEVTLENGEHLDIICKDLSWASLIEEARYARPVFLYDPLREIKVYQSILIPHGYCMANFYGSWVNHRRQIYTMFLEKLTGPKLRHVGEVSIWKQVAAWSAGMHSHFAASPAPLSLAQRAHLIHYDRGFFRVWIQRAVAAVRRTRGSRSHPEVREIEWLAERYEPVIQRLVSLPHTFIHGDFFDSNILIQYEEGEPHIHPIDWEMAAIGPGLVDLAALTAGSWTEEEQEALAMAYYEALPPVKGWPPERGEFLELLEYCRLHLAVQWVGWSASWDPPPEERQNWLSDAIKIARKLKL